MFFLGDTGVTFFSAVLRKERASGGPLSSSWKKWAKSRFETNGFKTSLPSRVASVMGREWELTQQQTRCRSRSGEENGASTVLSTTGSLCRIVTSTIQCSGQL